MNLEDFHDVAQQLFLKLDQLYSDHLNIEDTQLGDGVLTLTKTNNQKIIISRQSPVQEIWVATPSGGYHFRWSPEKKAWIDNKSHQTLDIFIKLAVEQSSS